MSQVKDDLFDYLKEIGLMPSFDEDEDIVFKYNLATCFILFHDGDENFIQITIPNIYRVDEDNRDEVLQACNTVNSRIKVAKCYITPNDRVWVTAEHILDPMPNYESFIPRILRILIGAKMLFAKEILE